MKKQVRCGVTVCCARNCFCGMTIGLHVSCVAWFGVCLLYGHVDMGTSPSDRFGDCAVADICQGVGSWYKARSHLEMKTDLHLNEKSSYFNETAHRRLQQLTKAGMHPHLLAALLTLITMFTPGIGTACPKLKADSRQPGASVLAESWARLHPAAGHARSRQHMTLPLVASTCTRVP